MSNKLFIEGKTLFFKDGYIKKGFVHDKTVFPLFHQSQKNSNKWLTGLSSKSTVVKDLKKLKKLIREAATKADQINKYKEFFKSQNIPLEVINRAFEKSNNDIAILQRPELQEESKAADDDLSKPSSSPATTSSSSSEDEMTEEQLQKELDEVDKEIRATNVKIRAGGRRGGRQQMTRDQQSIRARIIGNNPYDEGAAMAAAAPPGRRKTNPTMNRLKRLTNRREQIIEKMLPFIIKIIEKKEPVALGLTQEEKNELVENMKGKPSKVLQFVKSTKGMKLTKKITKGKENALITDFYLNALYDVALNKPSKTEPGMMEEPEKMETRKEKTQKFKETRQRQREDIENNRFMGKILELDDLAKGEYGYVLNGKLYPMFKMDIAITNEDKWEFVSQRMLSQERELFKKMSRMNEQDGYNLYTAFYNSDDYRIPLEIIDISYETANNAETRGLMGEVRRNFAPPTAEGYNISDYEPDDTLLETFTGYIERLQVGDRVDMDAYEAKEKVEYERKIRGDEDYQNYSKSPEEISQLFATIDPMSGGVTEDLLKASRRTLADIMENEPIDEINLDYPSEKLEEAARRMRDGEPIPQAAPAAAAPAAAAPAGAPPPPPPPRNFGNQTAADVSGEIKQRLQDESGTAGYGETEQTGLDRDAEPDVGIHNEAIQRIAVANDYDFTFTMKSLLMVNPLPKDKKQLIAMGTKCIVEYGFLLNIMEPLDNFSEREVAELYTLKHILKQVIRLESQYKKTLVKMTGGSDGGSIDLASTLNELINNGQVGVIVDTPQAPQVQPQAVPGGVLGAVPPTVQQQTNIFEEFGMRNKKKKGRLNVTKKQRQRKAKLKGPDKVIFRGRLNPNPQYQNLRTEAANIAQTPILLEFKSNRKTDNIPIYRRLN